MPTKEKVDVRDLIMEHLKQDDRTVAYLEKKTGLSYAHLYYVFVKKERDLTDDNLIKINEVLGTDFEK
jgi:plasmid maintenance system antidote protein VapI